MISDFVYLDAVRYPGLSGLDCACQNDSSTQPGLGAIMQTQGVFTDQDTGHQVIPTAGGFYDPINRISLDPQGRVVGSGLAAEVPGSTIGDDAQAALTSLGTGIRAVQADPTLGPLAALGLSKLIPGYAPPTPTPPPTPGPSIGTVLLWGLGLAGAGYGAHRAGWI